MPENNEEKENDDGRPDEGIHVPTEPREDDTLLPQNIDSVNASNNEANSNNTNEKATVAENGEGKINEDINTSVKVANAVDLNNSLGADELNEENVAGEISNSNNPYEQVTAEEKDEGKLDEDIKSCEEVANTVNLNNISEANELNEENVANQTSNNNHSDNQEEIADKTAGFSDEPPKVDDNVMHHDVSDEEGKIPVEFDTNQNSITEKEADESLVDESVASRFLPKTRTEYFENLPEIIDIAFITPHAIKMLMRNLSTLLTVHDIKSALVNDTQVDYRKITIKVGGKIPKDSVKLQQIVRNMGTELTFVLDYDLESEAKPRLRLGSRILKTDADLEIAVHCVKRKIINASEIEVDLLHLETRLQDGSLKQIDVTISWQPLNRVKPYLGGFRNVITNTVYHHAKIQTKPNPKPPYPCPHFSRDTQTYRMRHFGQATLNEMSTQMTKPGCYVSNITDKLMVPGPYETADEYLERRLRHIIILQKHWRSWLAKRKVEALRRQRDICLAYERAEEERVRRERKERIERDLQRRLHPRTQADIDRLYVALEQWRVEETTKINEKGLEEAERKALLVRLLDQEAELIAAIMQHQRLVTKDSHRRSQVGLLRRAASAKRWVSGLDKRPIEMFTPYILRAKELLDIYESLKQTCLTQDERLDILLTLKQTVREHNCSLTREIAELVDREADFLIRGVNKSQLEGLRSRLLSRFLQYAKTPTFNPEIGKHLRVPTGTVDGAVEHLRGDVNYCISCNRYLRTSQFPLAARATRLMPCRDCRRVDNRARLRQDLAPYKQILMELRNNEAKALARSQQVAVELARTTAALNVEARLASDYDAEIIRLLAEQNRLSDGSPKVEDITSQSLPLLMSEEDIRYIVDEIWERHSALSGWSDMADLCLTRWRVEKPWAPWNTILVTREEAQLHVRLSGDTEIGETAGGAQATVQITNEAAYGDAFIDRVRQRLVMASNAFSRLAKLARIQMDMSEAEHKRVALALPSLPKNFFAGIGSGVPTRTSSSAGSKDASRKTTANKLPPLQGAGRFRLNQSEPAEPKMQDIYNTSMMRTEQGVGPVH